MFVILALHEEQLEATHTINSRRKKPFKCNVCDESLTNNWGLNRHLSSVHERKKPFKCNICDVSFTEMGKLNSHVLLVHERKKPFKCIFCDISFS